MVRRIIKIDTEKCKGSGLCATAYHEGAITITTDGRILEGRRSERISGRVENSHPGRQLPRIVLTSAKF